MTITEIALILSAAVLGIAAFWHFYWALGGTKGLNVAVPEKPASAGGGPQFVPSSLATLAAGLHIAILAALYAFEARAFSIGEIDRRAFFAPWEIVVVGIAGLGFLLRAIGDFNHVGFFKRNTGTPFANADSRYFSPLCLFLGASGLSAAAARYF